MSDGQGQDDGGGCLALFAVLLAIGAAVAALLSIAALIDPFSWMPAAGELWEDCPAEYENPRPGRSVRSGSLTVRNPGATTARDTI